MWRRRSTERQAYGEYQPNPSQSVINRVTRFGIKSAKPPVQIHFITGEGDDDLTVGCERVGAHISTFA